MTSVTVAIDGPSGSGKSTVSHEVARRLGVPHIDTGAMYRAVTLAAMRRSVSGDDGPELASMITGLSIEVEGSAVTIDGEDVTTQIRSSEVTEQVSQVASHPEVRERLVSLQRDLAREGVVMEGRDIGTVVLPQASLKVFLTARDPIRARRRARETGDDELRVAEALARRDEFDSTRRVSPLRPADDAVVIDTSDSTADQVADQICDLLERRG